MNHGRAFDSPTAISLPRGGLLAGIAATPDRYPLSGQRAHAKQRLLKQLAQRRPCGLLDTPAAP